MHLVHTDLKPENILFVDDQVEDNDQGSSRKRIKTGQDTDRTILVSPKCTSVKCKILRFNKNNQNNDVSIVIDFGGATYDSDSKSTIISTRQYRAPEVMLGLNWSTPADLWSAGCIIGELYLGNLFFPTHEQMEHYAMIEKCVGPFPKTMISKALGARIEACDVRTYFKTSTFELRPLHTHLKSSSRRRVENMPHLQNAFSMCM